MNIRVIMLDDEKSLRDLFKIALNRRGYEIYEFENPSKCPLYNQDECKCPDEERCTDIIITDVKMPVMNGIEFIKSQKEKGCKATNIIVMSGSMTEDIRKESEALGCICLSKPFSFEEFNKILDEFENDIDPDRKLIRWESLNHNQ